MSQSMVTAEEELFVFPIHLGVCVDEGPSNLLLDKLDLINGLVEVFLQLHLSSSS